MSKLKIVFLFITIAFAKNSFGEEDLFFIGQKAFEKGYYAISIGYLEKFLQKNTPKSPFYLEASILRGECYYYEGKYRQALESFQKLLDISESKSIKDLIFFWMAECYFRENEFKMARDFYSKVISDFPNSDYCALSLYSIGWSLFYEGNFKEALHNFQNFLEKFPKDKLAEDASFKIIECLYNLKSYPELKKSIDSYLIKFPETKYMDFLFLYKAEALFYLEMYLEAIPCYQRVIHNSKDLRLKNLAQLGLGYSYLKLNKTPEAFQEFNRLIESLDDRELILEAYLGKADTLYAMDKYSEAEEIYQRIEGLFPEKNLDRIHYGLGLCLLKQNRFIEAKEEFLKVSLKSPDYPEAIYLAGICLYNLNNYKEAYFLFENLLNELNPEERLAQRAEFYISDGLFRMGKKNLALNRFKNLRVKYPNSEITPEVLHWLGI